MSWFDDQLEIRLEKDNEQFESAFYNIADSIMGQRLSSVLGSGVDAQSAIEEVLAFYGISPKKDLEFKGKTLEEQMDYQLKPLGVSRREVYLDKEWYKNAYGPMLGFKKDSGEVVAFIPGKIKGYTFYNSETRQYEKINKNNVNLFENDAICFYQPLPMKKLNIADLLIFMFKQFSTSDIILYLFVMLAVTLMGMISPWITKILFSTVIESGKISLLVSIAVFTVCYTLSNRLVQTYQTFISSRVGIKQEMAVRSAVMHRVISLPATFFKDYSSGELTQIASYVQNLCSTLINTIGMTGVTSLFSLLYIGQIFSFAPAMVVPSLIITAVTVLFSLITTFGQMKISKKQMILASKESGMSYSMITGVQKIKLSGSEKRMFSRWANLYAQSAALTYNPPTYIKQGPTINLAINLLGNVILYYMAYKSNVSVANYYAFNAAYAMVAGAFMSLSSIATAVAQIKPILEISRPILETEPEISEGKELVTGIRGSIELDNVSFRYNDSMPNVIDDLSLKIRPGEYVAIVGKTGCGKSTLLRLMLGFEKPTKGSIYYDRKDISKLDLPSLRRKIGVVMQNGKLFTGDIYSNIVISAPQLSLDDAWEAAEMAAIANDIREMPMGMHTLISEGQGGISGGQKQRLMIARAIAPKPKVLMFDEATSALDNMTQKHVSEAIDSLKCTRIVIAHRLSTIRHCDRILVLDKGKVIEQGTYDSLIEQNGFFAELVARQRLDVDSE